MPAPDIAAIRRRLLGWYEKHRRDLPWRRTSDPYAIWISETMLQQTQVATVIPYYQRFMNAFPNVHVLDRAPHAKVLALWSGLGYYRRAEHLKESARLLARGYRGRLPDDYDKLRALPGIGNYTAGALLSIAFGKPYPAVDGNVRRVLSRIFMLDDEKQIREIAQKLVPRSKPGQFNQGLMDLGRMLCVPRDPHCPRCPIKKLCATQTRGQRIHGGRLKKRPATRGVVWPLAILRCGGKVLLRRRADKGLLGGLWEFPGGEIANRWTIPSFLRIHLRGLNATAAQALRLGQFRHSITTRRIRAPVFLIDVDPASKAPRQGPSWRWVASTALDRYPTSSMTRKAAKLLAKHEKSHH